MMLQSQRGWTMTIYSQWASQRKQKCARKDTEKSHTQSSSVRSVSPLDLSCGKHSIIIFLNSLSHFSPSVHRSQSGEMPRTGRWCTARLMQIDNSYPRAISSLYSTWPAGFSSGKSTRARNQTSSVLLWGNSATTVSTQPPCGKHCCLCHCLSSSLQQLLKKERAQVVAH